MPKKTSTTTAPGSTPTGSTSNLASTTPSTPYTLILKSTRNPTLTLTLKNAPAETTSLHDLKTHLQAKLDGEVELEKIKILYKKRPITGGNGRTVTDILGADAPASGAEIEFGVMIMGGAVATAAEETIDLAPPAPSHPLGTSSSTAEAAATPEAPKEPELKKEESAPPVQGISGAEVLKTEEFWSDLHSFLLQRVKDETEAEKLTALFRSGWKSTQ